MCTNAPDERRLQSDAAIVREADERAPLGHHMTLGDHSSTMLPNRWDLFLACQLTESPCLTVGF